MDTTLIIVIIVIVIVVIAAIFFLPSLTGGTSEKNKFSLESITSSFSGLTSGFNDLWKKIKSYIPFMNSFTIEKKALYLGFKDIGKKAEATSNAMYDFTIKTLTNSQNGINDQNKKMEQTENEKAKAENRQPVSVEIANIKFDPAVIQKIFVEATEKVFEKGDQEALYVDKERTVREGLVPALTDEIITIFKNVYTAGFETELAKAQKALTDEQPNFTKIIQGDETNSGVYDIVAAQSYIDNQLMDFHLNGGQTDNTGSEYRDIHGYVRPSVLNTVSDAGPTLIKQLINKDVKNGFDSSAIPDEIKPKNLDNELINLDMANLANNMENPATKPFIATRKYLDPRGLSDGMIDMIAGNIIGKDPNSIQMPVKGTGIDFINSGLGFGNEDKIDNMIDNYARKMNGTTDSKEYDWENILGQTANKDVTPNVDGNIRPDNMNDIINDIISHNNIHSI